MKPIKEWLAELPVPYNHLALEETYRWNADKPKEFKSQYYLRTGLDSALIAAFPWNNSIMGYDFWEGIQDNVNAIREKRTGIVRTTEREAKRYEPRKTSLTAFENVKKSGVLSVLRLKVYETLCANGPMTANEVRLKISSIPNSGVFTTRLSELERMGAVKTIGTRADAHTGHNSLVWDITGRIPKKIVLTRKTRKQKKINAVESLNEIISFTKKYTTSMPIQVNRKIRKDLIQLKRELNQL